MAILFLAAKRHFGAWRASLGRLEVSQVQRFFTGNAPVVGLVAHPVVPQGGFVVDRQPFDGVRGQSLQEQQTAVDQNVRLVQQTSAVTFGVVNFYALLNI